MQDRREYDEPTVLNWISGDRASRSSSSGSNSARLGYPSQSGAAAAAAAAASGSSADQVRGAAVSTAVRVAPHPVLFTPLAPALSGARWITGRVLRSRFCFISLFSVVQDRPKFQNLAVRCHLFAVCSSGGGQHLTPRRTGARALIPSRHFRAHQAGVWEPGLPGQQRPRIAGPRAARPSGRLPEPTFPHAGRVIDPKRVVLTIQTL